jgi:large subunit ribosomal protein L24
MKLKKGDQVVVVAGNNKNEKGLVKEVVAGGERVVISKVNVRKKHIKPSQDNPQGGRIEVEAPVHVSNVMAWSEKANKPSRIKIETRENGKKVRVLKVCGSEYGAEY